MTEHKAGRGRLTLTAWAGKVESRASSIETALGNLTYQIGKVLEENALFRGEDDGTEKCMNCESMVEQVWHAPDKLWNSLSGYPDGNGILCVRCFDRLALSQEVYLYWSCTPDKFHDEEN